MHRLLKPQNASNPCQLQSPNHHWNEAEVTQGAVIPMQYHPRLGLFLLALMVFPMQVH